MGHALGPMDGRTTTEDAEMGLRRPSRKRTGSGEVEASVGEDVQMEVDEMEKHEKKQNRPTPVVNKPRV